MSLERNKSDACLMQDNQPGLGKACQDGLEKSNLPVTP
jgi:hypothetical protein